MKISVIIPFFNDMKKLQLVLHNLQGVQTRPPDEIIVVDDDSTEAIVEILSEIYHFIYVKTDVEKDGKHRAGHARNKGAEISNGEILVFQDQDVLLGRDYIKEVELYYKNHASIVTGSFEDIPEDLQELDKKTLFKYIGEKEDWRDKRLQPKNVAELVRYLPELAESRQFAISRKQFEETGRFDENFIGWGCEDTEFFWRNLHDHNYQIYHSKKLFSFHLEHPVDPVYLIESMKRNADYFTQLYPEAKQRLMHLWRGFGIYYDNTAVTRSYDFCKKVREETNIHDFGKISSMRHIGLWRY